jgi:hypothetical protein
VSSRSRPVAEEVSADVVVEGDMKRIGGLGSDPLENRKQTSRVLADARRSIADGAVAEEGRHLLEAVFGQRGCDFGGRVVLRRLDTEAALVLQGSKLGRFGQDCPGLAVDHLGLSVTFQSSVGY